MARSAPTLPGDWAERGACRGDTPTDWFVIDTTYRRDQPGRYERARKVCAHCPVNRQCLEHAIVNDECCGMWGGLLPFERRKLRRRGRYGRITFTPDGRGGFTISTTITDHADG